MDVVKQNAFWFGVGGVVLVVLLVGGVMIMGLKGEASAAEAGIAGKGSELETLLAKGTDLPAGGWKAVAEEHVASLEKTRDEIRKYLITEGGKHLGTWFPDLNVRSGEPSIDQFKPVYLLKTEELKRALEEKGIRVGPPKRRPGAGLGGSTDEEGGFERVPDPTQGMMSALQKHYWVQKRLVDVLSQTKGDAALALLNVKFKDAAAVASSGAAVSSGSGMPVAPPASAEKLPLGLGVVIEFEASVEIFYPDVTRFLENFLKVDPKANPSVFARIKKVEIKKTTTPPEKKDVKIPSDEQDDPKWANLQPDRIPVKLVLTGEILDFLATAK